MYPDRTPSPARPGNCPPHIAREPAHPAGSPQSHRRSSESSEDISNETPQWQPNDPAVEPGHPEASKLPPQAQRSRAPEREPKSTEDRPRSPALSRECEALRPPPSRSSDHISEPYPDQCKRSPAGPPPCRALEEHRRNRSRCPSYRCESSQEAARNNRRAEDSAPPRVQYPSDRWAGLAPKRHRLRPQPNP